jgi:hypothetical protein
MSRMREVRILRCIGCWNSRCLPRPRNFVLRIEPPQVEFWICTTVGSGQNAGWPEMTAIPFSENHRFVDPVLGLHG